MDAQAIYVDENGETIWIDSDLCHNYIEGKPVLTIEEAEEIAGCELDPFRDYYYIPHMGGTISAKQLPENGACVRLLKEGVMDEFGEEILTKDAVKRIIDLLQEYYEKYDELYENYVKAYKNQVIEYVRECFRPREEDKPTQEVKKTTNGYIYVMLHQGYYKIGKSVDCRRLGEYTKLAEEPKYIYVVYVNDMDGTEKKLHRMFDDKRCRDGKCEWFDLDTDDLEKTYNELKLNEIKDVKHTEWYKKYILKEDI